MSDQNKDPKMNMPRAYVEGSVFFFDLKLKVSPVCLIPRQESELLVERALQRFPLQGNILDLCSGSGALGLAIKKLRPSLDVTLADISKEAILLSKENARENGLEVEFIQGDFLEPLKGRVFDGIICNPPYVTEDEYKYLDPSVKDFEPKLALVGGEDGLKFYKKLAKEVFFHLKIGGFLCLEIGKDQGKSVEELFSDSDFKGKKVEKDYSSHDRFFFLEKRERGI
jgi:release factor glutamine methyltransferase